MSPWPSWARPSVLSSRETRLQRAPAISTYLVESLTCVSNSLELWILIGSVDLIWCRVTIALIFIIKTQRRKKKERITLVRPGYPTLGRISFPTSTITGPIGFLHKHEQQPRANFNGWDDVQTRLQRRTKAYFDGPNHGNLSSFIIRYD
jgi:hypothetical protein